MSEEAAAANSANYDLKPRLYDEKKITDGLFAAKLIVKPLGSVQQSARHRKQQAHTADVLQKRAAAANAEEATAAEVAEDAAAARASEERTTTKVAEQAAATKAVAAKTSAQAVAAKTTAQEVAAGTN